VLECMYRQARQGRQPLRVYGIIEITVRDRRGHIIKKIVKRNLITDAGIQYIVQALAAQVSLAAFKYIAVGSGTTPPSGSDTGLESEVTRVEGTISLESTNISNDTLRVDASITFDASYTIAESGLFNAATGGTMLARQTFDAFTVDAGYTLDVTWRIIVSR